MKQYVEIMCINQYTDTDGGAIVSMYETLSIEKTWQSMLMTMGRDCKEMKRETMWLLMGRISQVEEIIN